MAVDDFQKGLEAHFDRFRRTLATDSGDWAVKGFIDAYKNIGSILSIPALLAGNGSFAPYGQEVFDDYWMNYLTEDMARAIDSAVPYHNPQQYWEWRERIRRRGVKS